MTYRGIVQISNEIRLVVDTARQVRLAAQCTGNAWLKCIGARLRSGQGRDMERFINCFVELPVGSGLTAPVLPLHSVA